MYVVRYRYEYVYVNGEREKTPLKSQIIFLFPLKITFLERNTALNQIRYSLVAAVPRNNPKILIKNIWNEDLWGTSLAVKLMIAGWTIISQIWSQYYVVGNSYPGCACQSRLGPHKTFNVIFHYPQTVLPDFKIDQHYANITSPPSREREGRWNVEECRCGYSTAGMEWI